MKQLLTDILKTTDVDKKGYHYSQSRIYLLIVMVLILTGIVGQVFTDLPLERVKISLEYLFYLVMIFGGYNISKKAIGKAKEIKENIK